MLVYVEDKQQFLSDVSNNVIDRKVEQKLREKLRRGVSRSERQAFINSLTHMQNILSDEEIPSDCGVAIEYSIPNTAYRVDFILTGYDADNQHRAIIVELKQWSEVYPLEGVEQLLRFNEEAEIRDVRTFLGGGLRKTAHPSYQAWSYSTFISDYNSNVETIPIHLKSCAYLHNYYLQEEDDPLFKPYFKEILKEAPLFCRKDVADLKAFIDHVYLSSQFDSRLKKVMRISILVSNQTKPGGNTTHDRFKCYQRTREKATVIHYRRGSYAVHVAVDYREVYGDRGSS